MIIKKGLYPLVSLSVLKFDRALPEMIDSQRLGVKYPRMGSYPGKASVSHSMHRASNELSSLLGRPTLGSSNLQTILLQTQEPSS